MKNAPKKKAFKALVFPSAQLVVKLTLLGYQLINLLLGTPDWVALLSQSWDTAISMYEFVQAAADQTNQPVPRTTRFKTLMLPGAQLLIDITLLGYQVTKMLLGMLDWLALLSQAKDAGVSIYQFVRAVAHLSKTQESGTPRNDQDVPPAC